MRITHCKGVALPCHHYHDQSHLTSLPCCTLCVAYSVSVSTSSVSFFPTPLIAFVTSFWLVVAVLFRHFHWIHTFVGCMIDFWLHTAVEERLDEHENPGVCVCVCVSVCLSVCLCGCLTAFLESLMICLHPVFAPHSSSHLCLAQFQAHTFTCSTVHTAITLM